ncbi:MAG: BatA domain-containing protein [Planctomycetaceae bacterium]
MSLLAPLYALGLAAVALPVLFHLARQTAKNRREFAATMFLEEVRPRVARRRNIEDRLLLLLRGLAVAVLCLAFARPFFETADESHAANAASRRLAILIDASASMRRDGLWELALGRAEAALDELDPGDRAALYVFDDRPRCVVPFAQATERDGTAVTREALRALRGESPGWNGTDLGAALTAALDDFARGRSAETFSVDEILLVGDMQEGVRLESLDWPPHVALRIAMVEPASATNAGLALVADSAETIFDESLRVRVTNAAASNRDVFRLQWQDAAGTAVGAAIDVHVPAGTARVRSVPRPQATRTLGASGSLNPATRLVLTGDDHEFDNTLHVLPLEQQAWRLVFAGDAAADDPRRERYYLERAFPETPLRRVEIVGIEPTAPPLSSAARDIALVVVAGPLDETQAAAISRRIATGGTALVALSSPEMEATLRAILDEPGIRITESESGEPRLLTEIDFAHPLFAPFADARYSDFAKIHFWRRRIIELPDSPAANVLARFDDGRPAIVEVGHGSGRVFMFASGWHPADSQLALSSKFVPLLERMLELSRGAENESRQLAIGQSIRLAGFSTDSDVANEIAIETPAAGTVRLTSNETAFAETNSPGVYVVSAVAEPERNSRIAVNVPPAESRTDPLSMQRLAALGLPIAAPASSANADSDLRAAEERANRAAEFETQQQLWRWLLVGAVGLLIAETWLASRRANTPVGH